MQSLDGFPRGALDPEDVRSAITAETGSARIRWGVETSADEGITWDPAPVGVRSGDVKWSYRVPMDRSGSPTSSAKVRRTASLEVIGAVEDAELLDLWWRPFVEMLTPSQAWARFHLGVFVSTLSPVSYDGTLTVRQLDLADKTHLYASHELTESIQFSYLQNGLLAVRADMEARFGETTFQFPAGDSVLQDDLVFEAGTSALTAYNAVLEACGYEALFVNEQGEPTTRRADALFGIDPEWWYEPGTIMLAPGQVTPLLPEIPNRLIVVAQRGPSLPEEGNGIVTVENLDYGPASFDQRGRWVTHRVEVEATDQEDLERVAVDMSVRYFAGGGLTYRGRIGLNPLHSDRDVVGLVKPSMGLDGKWVVTGWTIPLPEQVASEGDVTMSLELERLVGADRLLAGYFGGYRDGYY